MNKNQALTLLSLIEVVFILGIIILAGIFENWYLLFLLMFVSSTRDRQAILKSKEVI